MIRHNSLNDAGWRFGSLVNLARRLRVFAPGLLYQVIVRGNQRRKTFRRDDDYKAYLDRLDSVPRQSIPTA
jgi:hypothetical protein